MSWRVFGDILKIETVSCRLTPRVLGVVEYVVLARLLLFGLALALMFRICLSLVGLSLGLLCHERISHLVVTRRRHI